MYSGTYLSYTEKNLILEVLSSAQPMYLKAHLLGQLLDAREIVVVHLATHGGFRGFPHQRGELRAERRLQVGSGGVLAITYMGEFI